MHLQMQNENMKKTAVIMGMPVTISIIDKDAKDKDIDEIFDYFRRIDEKFSTYKEDSEIGKINKGKIKRNFSSEMKKILGLSEKTKKETGGYFDIKINGKLDPSGIVKGYAIHEACKIFLKKGYKNFYVEIAGDVEVYGKIKGRKWRIGLENPFNRKEIIKTVNLSDRGIATSGNYIRGSHIFDPIKKRKADEIMSITVIGPNVYEADRFATAAFAMGNRGIDFIEDLSGFEGYLVTKNRMGIMTSGFEKYL